MNDTARIEIEASAFRSLIKHLQHRTDVQNIDLMNLAGFCRNCLAKWYLAAAKDHNIELSYDQARKVVYGVPFDEWKQCYQTEATPEQKTVFEKTKPLHALISGH